MADFRKSVTSSFQFGKFKLKSLPLAFVAGLKVAEITDEKAVVTIKHNYRTKNPFRSMYFGAQAMAAELATGILVLEQVDKARPVRVSMLVGKMTAEFTKKAVGIISFTCEDAPKLAKIFEKVIASPEGQILSLEAIGRNEKGEMVSKFTFEWSLRRKSSPKPIEKT